MIFQTLRANNFDEEFMVKKLPEIPEEYQPDPFYRYLGIISPSCRMMHWNSDFEFDALRYMCYRRTMTRYWWKSLYRAVRKRRKKEMNSEKLDYIENIRLKLLNNERLTDAEFRSVIAALHESKECFQEPYYELVYHDKYDRVERRVMNPTKTLTFRADCGGVNITEDQFDLTFRRIVHEEEKE